MYQYSLQQNNQPLTTVVRIHPTPQTFHVTIYNVFGFIEWLDMFVLYKVNNQIYSKCVNVRLVAFTFSVKFALIMICLLRNACILNVFVYRPR